MEEIGKVWKSAKEQLQVQHQELRKVSYTQCISVVCIVWESKHVLLVSCLHGYYGDVHRAAVSITKDHTFKFCKMLTKKLRSTLIE